MTVIERDFGKKPRETVRRFRELLALDALHEHNIRENPLPYLERASERIFQLERALFDAVQALSPKSEPCAENEMLTLRKQDYLGLLRCSEIVQEALKEYGIDEEP